MDRVTKLMAFFMLSSLLFSFSLKAGKEYPLFSDKECINSAFEEKVTSDSYIFGLFYKELSLKKEGCLITLNYNAFRWTHINWSFDVCREPVHLKKGEELFFSPKSSFKPEQSQTFVQEKDYIFELIQTMGLIFAEGAKENIDTAHGHFYCSYLLLKKYLNEGNVFNQSLINKQESYTLIKETKAPQTPLIAPKSVPANRRP